MQSTTTWRPARRPSDTCTISLRNMNVGFFVAIFKKWIISRIYFIFIRKFDISWKLIHFSIKLKINIFKEISLENNMVTPAADIYAFGVCALEVKLQKRNKQTKNTLNNIFIQLLYTKILNSFWKKWWFIEMFEMAMTGALANPSSSSSGSASNGGTTPGAATTTTTSSTTSEGPVPEEVIEKTVRLLEDPLQRVRVTRFSQIYKSLFRISSSNVFAKIP